MKSFLYVVQFLQWLSKSEQMCLKSYIICTFPNLFLSVII
jgi:hypothetical protein